MARSTVKNLSGIFRILEVVEGLYLLTFAFVLYASQFPSYLLMGPTEIWLLVSYMLLPILLLKNIIVALYGNGMLDAREKVWVIVRSVLYILLTYYSYPLVVSVASM